MYYGVYMQQDSAVERIVLADQFMVSKTDLRGVITYANQYFMDISLYTEEEWIGKPHSILRHVDMPRCVFALLWEKIECGEEIFAYVKNRCKNGDYYWVLAYVTAEKDPHTGEIVGYFSFRRSPSRVAIDAICDLYALLRNSVHTPNLFLLTKIDVHKIDVKMAYQYNKKARLITDAI